MFGDYQILKDIIELKNILTKMINNLDIKKINEDFISNGCKYVIIDNLFPNELILECEKEFKQLSDDNFIRYGNKYFEFEKYALNDVNKMPTNLRNLFDYIHSDEFIQTISDITSIDNLLCDEKRWGGGLHKTKKDGYLSIHKDFNVLPSSYNNDKQWLRCLNLIGYVSSDWFEMNNGTLEFWSDENASEIIKVENKFNRWVIFDTRNCYHGHPHPFKGENRMSVASYYYLEQNISNDVWSSTEYLKLPWMEESEDYATQRKERSDYKKRYLNNGK